MDLCWDVTRVNGVKCYDCEVDVLYATETYHAVVYFSGSSKNLEPLSFYACLGELGK
jgi:hypothetical protein